MNAKAISSRDWLVPHAFTILARSTMELLEDWLIVLDAVNNARSCS